MQTNAPTELADLLRSGAVLNGMIVLSVQIETVDGRVQKLQLPATELAEVEAEIGDLDDESKEDAVLRILGDLKAEVWMPGKTLAAAVDLVYGGGRWGRTLKNLKEKVESHRVHGYRLKKFD